MEVGDRIKTYRELTGLTSTELAKKIGISKELMYRYEKGLVSNIPVETVKAIAKALMVEPSVLLGIAPQGMEQQLDEIHKTKLFLNDFDKLNELGKYEIKNYIEELVKQKKYTELK